MRATDAALGEIKAPYIVDTHVHLWDFPDRPDIVPFRPLAVGSIEEWMEEVFPHGVSNGVTVFPSVGQGKFNITYVRDVLDRFPDTFRGVISLNFTDPSNTSEATLDEFDDIGIRSIKYKLTNQKQIDAFFNDTRADSFVAVSKFMRERRWSWTMQITSEVGEVWPEVLDTLFGTGVKIVCDHFGRPNFTRGLDDPAFKAISQYGDTGRVYVKFSAPFRIDNIRSKARDDQILEYAREYLKAFGDDNIIFGTDWPYIGEINETRPTYDELLENFYTWVPDEDSRFKIMWDNPRRLYGFGKPKRYAGD
ncbi:hypothetical protein CYMTET_27073 [Cymbomonas tetramitiformis]|uniref:Amidohydrolase-related domain-containing protein n=1 Tax=Cymbomonas tetramitiformis TaxID=36881 RepID=A0AAE0KXI7_9CHLO|nr:hypothetical protein CYMTET_27073 [Cymbomonas tetramitiformis]